MVKKLIKSEKKIKQLTSIYGLGLCKSDKTKDLQQKNKTLIGAK